MNEPLLYSFEINNNNIVINNENIKMMDTKQYIDDILKSYKYKTKNILNQIDIDFPRINVSLNNKKIQTQYELFTKLNFLNKHSYSSNDKKYNLMLIILMLCCQSSYGYQYEDLFYTFCNNKHNLLLCNSNNNRNIKFIVNDNDICIEIETNLIVKDIILNSYVLEINTKLIIDITIKNDEYVFNNNCIYFWSLI